MTSKTLLDKPKCHWDICLALLYQRFQCCNNCVSEKNSGSPWAGKMLGQNYWTITICTSISTLHPLRVDIASCHDTASGAKQHRIQGNQPRHASALTYAARSFDTISIWNDGNSAHFQSEESLQMFATSLFSHTMGELSAYNLFQLVKPAMAQRFTFTLSNHKPSPWISPRYLVRAKISASPALAFPQLASSTQSAAWFPKSLRFAAYHAANAAFLNQWKEKEVIKALTNRHKSRQLTILMRRWLQLQPSFHEISWGGNSPVKNWETYFHSAVRRRCIMPSKQYDAMLETSAVLMFFPVYLCLPHILTPRSLSWAHGRIIGKICKHPNPTWPPDFANLLKASGHWSHHHTRRKDKPTSPRQSQKQAEMMYRESNMTYGPVQRQGKHQPLSRLI